MALRLPLRGEDHLVQLWDAIRCFDPDDPSFGDYLDACEAYYKRQLVVYEHWPQRKYGPMGYTAEKQFVDQNA